MMNGLYVLIRWLTRLFGLNVYRTEYHEELPFKLKHRVLYILGDKINPWSAALLCPCGCKDKIQLSLLPDDRPTWKINKYNRGKVSLEPSVWRQRGCKSHFFFTHNEIHWC